MSKKGLLIYLTLFFFSAINSVHAQNSDDVLRYSLEYPSYDAVSLVIPAVSQPTGFGAYQENPAVMALYDESFFSFDLSSRFVDESGTYLGNISEFSDNETHVGDLGYVYRFPTDRGSLVVGGGYSQTTDFNRALSASGFNGKSTITDFYNSSFVDDSLFFAAFDAYALDFATTDSSYDETTSIFRVGPDGFQGINQDMELTERGRMGDLSVFVATEFAENFFIGASIGYLSGIYNYNREFLESDSQDDYDILFYNDINNILSVDDIESEFEAFSARFGLVFEPIKMLSIGAGYQFPQKLHIDETFNTSITTTFDNGDQFFEDTPSKFSYKIIRPQRIRLGATLKDINGFNFSASLENIMYSNARIEFDELVLNPKENDINTVVRSSFEDVINLRLGIEYRENKQFSPRVGYGYFPSPQEGIDQSRQFLNGGFSAELTQGLIFDFGLQYSFWEDENTIYITPTDRETVQEDVTRLHVMTGIRMMM